MLNNIWLLYMYENSCHSHVRVLFSEDFFPECVLPLMDKTKGFTNRLIVLKRQNKHTPNECTDVIVEKGFK